MPMRPAGGYGATIWAQRWTGVLTTPWPFGPGQQDPELVAEGDELGLGPLALLARLAVAGGRDERGGRALGRAGPQQGEVGRRRRAHDDEVDRVVRGAPTGRRPFGRPSTTSRLEVGAEDPTHVAGGQQVVHHDEPELAGMGRGPGDEDAAGLEQRLELGRRRRLRSGGGDAIGRCAIAELDERVDGDRDAVGADDQRVDVHALDVVTAGDLAERRPGSPPTRRDRRPPRRGTARGGAGSPAGRSSRGP